jgi:nucleotide-binding universal stress UspA family protein
MPHCDEDHEGRSHLRMHRRGRSRSAGCTAGRDRSGLPTGFRGDTFGQDSLLPTAPVIVAGYDGTALGREAVVQAGLQAGPTGCVFVVYAYRSPRWSFRRFRRLRAARAAGRRALDDLFSGRTSLPDTDYVTELVPGKVADAICRVAVACRADAIVVGVRSPERFQTPLKPVSAEDLLVAGIPVVIVPDSHGMAYGNDADSSAFGDESAIPDIDAWW